MKILEKIFRLPRIWSLPTALYNFSILKKAEEKLLGKDFEAALSMLDKINWKNLAVEKELMRAECLMGQEKKKESMLVLRDVNNLIHELPEESRTKKYLDLYYAILVQKLSNGQVNSDALDNLYESIDFSKVPNLTKELFPINVRERQ